MADRAKWSNRSGKCSGQCSNRSLLQSRPTTSLTMGVRNPITPFQEKQVKNNYNETEINQFAQHEELPVLPRHIVTDVLRH